MVFVVLVLNGLIGLACLFVAWQLWQLKRKLGKVSETLLSIDRTIYKIFHPAPGYIYKGQMGTAKLRQSYQQLQPQLERLEKVLSLIATAQAVWRRRSLVRRR